MRLQKTIDFLLENACVNIQYLVYRDILRTPADEPFMKELQAEILQQKNVKKHLSAQHPDGWFGYELHGTDSMEGHVSALLRLGVEADNEYLQKAVAALLTPEIASEHKNWFHGGEALDVGGRGGNKAIVTSVLSSLKCPENETFMTDAISNAFEHLSAVLNYNTVDDFTVKGKKHRYYKPNIMFPGNNHISLLDMTDSWRSEENMQTAKAAARRAYALLGDFDEHIMFRAPKEYGSHFIGPFNYNWQALKPLAEDGLRKIINDPYYFHFGFWLGDVIGIPDWVRQNTHTQELLADMLEKDSLMDILPVEALKRFRMIMGIEPNWRSKTAVKCDVTYAVLKACLPIIR